MAHRRKNFRSYHKIQYQSPFFSLPPEIRNLIYQHALVYHKPIDLCPPSYTGDRCIPKAHLIMAARQEKQEQKYARALAIYEANESCGRVTAWDRKPAPPRKLYRDQDDLKYLRTQKCVALLSTCAQAYNEGNSDTGIRDVYRTHSLTVAQIRLCWLVLYRFLLTIGPVARSRLNKIQVMPPFAKPWCIEQLGGNESCVKNEPKLRMAYVGKEDSRVIAVLEMMRAEDLWRVAVELVLAGRQDIIVDWVNFPWGHETESQHTCKKIVLVAESCSKMDHRTIYALLEHGIDVRCEKGTFLTSDGPQTEEILDRPLSWNSTEADEFVGVPEMFAEQDQQEHARDGRVTKSAGSRKTARVLKGFGGCRFVSRRNFLGEETLEIKHKTRYMRMSALNF
ncbi:MAG: hypothetical protein Q9165_004573 [Trypethelium subeluteriae]